MLLPPRLPRPAQRSQLGLAYKAVTIGVGAIEQRGRRMGQFGAGD
jgi:hypothetical protein